MSEAKQCAIDTMDELHRTVNHRQYSEVLLEKLFEIGGREV